MSNDDPQTAAEIFAQIRRQTATIIADTQEVRDRGE